MEKIYQKILPRKKCINFQKFLNKHFVILNRVRIIFLFLFCKKKIKYLVCGVFLINNIDEILLEINFTPKGLN